MKVAILDANEVYLRRLHDYWSKTYGGNALIIYVFSSPDQLFEHITREKFDIVLMNHSMGIDVEMIPAGTMKIYLIPGKKDGEINEIPALAKNGNADELYLKMINIYEAHMNIEHRSLPGRLVLFTSADGGCGTSSCAVGYGKYMAAQGKKVLYLDLEMISAQELMLDGRKDKSMEDLFYLCESNRKNLNYSLESLVSVDSSGMEYIAACKNPVELLEKNSKDIDMVLTTVIKKGAYDIVVADRGLSFDDISSTLIRLAEVVILVAQPDAMGRRKLDKTMLLLDEMNKRGVLTNGKLKLLFNRSAGESRAEQEIIGNLRDWQGCDPKAVTDNMGHWVEYGKVLTE